jgi:hypothetical protein
VGGKMLKESFMESSKEAKLREAVAKELFSKQK